MGLKERVSGRLKKAAGDLAGDEGLRSQGAREERKADAQDELNRAQDEVEERAVRVRDSEVEAERHRRA